VPPTWWHNGLEDSARPDAASLGSLCSVVQVFKVRWEVCLLFGKDTMKSRIGPPSIFRRCPSKNDPFPPPAPLGAAQQHLLPSVST
jgi:hypothetical protein